MPPKTIRLVPNLSLAAIKDNLGKELSLWYCLRAINDWGSGSLDTQYAVLSLTEGSGYPKSTAWCLKRNLTNCLTIHLGKSGNPVKQGRYHGK